MRTRLRLTHVSPISVLKYSALSAIIVFLLIFGVLAGLYTALDVFGVISRVQDLAASVASSAENPNPLSFLDPSFVLPRLAIAVGGLVVVLIPLSVLFTLVANLILRVTDGIECTFDQSL